MGRAFVVPLLVLWLIVLGGSATAQRKVAGNTLESSELPKIRITVEPSMPYLGSFAFRLEPPAEGERYVFAESANGKVRRMFIVQFERMLDDRQYRFRMRTPVKLGRETYSHNLWFYNDEESRKADPPGEPVHTVKFLAERGLSLDTDLMMSRFARIVGEDKRNEIILFYWENLRDHGLSAKDFPEEQPVTPEQRKLGEGFYQRSLKAFAVED